MRVDPRFIAPLALVGATLILLVPLTHAAAPAARLKLLHAMGDVQVRQGSVWKKAAKGDPVLLPAVVRTGSGAETIVLLDWRLRAAVRLPAGSLLHIETPANLTLEQGQAWILVDEPLANHPRIRFRSGGLSVEAVVGSFILKGPENPALEVYTDSAQVRMGRGPVRRVDEGYRITGAGDPGRLEYRDYTDWREYANRFSVLKDDWAVRQLEEEYKA